MEGRVGEEDSSWNKKISLFTAFKTNWQIKAGK